MTESITPPRAASSPVAPEAVALAASGTSAEGVESGLEEVSTTLVAPPPSPASLGSPPQVRLSPMTLGSTSSLVPHSTSPGSSVSSAGSLASLRMRLRRAGDEWAVVPLRTLNTAFTEDEDEPPRPQRHVEVVTELFGMLLKRTVTTYEEY